MNIHLFFSSSPLLSSCLDTYAVSCILLVNASKFFLRLFSVFFLRTLFLSLSLLVLPYPMLLRHIYVQGSSPLYGYTVQAVTYFLTSMFELRNREERKKERKRKNGRVVKNDSLLDVCLLSRRLYIDVF